MKEVKPLRLYEKAINVMVLNLNGEIKKDRIVELVKKYVGEENVVTVIAYLYGWIDMPELPLNCGVNNELISANIFTNEVQYRIKYGPTTRYFSSEATANKAKNDPYPSKYYGSSAPYDNGVAVEFDNVYDTSYTSIDEWVRNAINNVDKEVNL